MDTSVFLEYFPLLSLFGLAPSPCVCQLGVLLQVAQTSTSLPEHPSETCTGKQHRETLWGLGGGGGKKPALGWDTGLWLMVVPRPHSQGGRAGWYTS